MKKYQKILLTIFSLLTILPQFFNIFYYDIHHNIISYFSGIILALIVINILFKQRKIKKYKYIIYYATNNEGDVLQETNNIISALLVIIYFSKKLHKIWHPSRVKIILEKIIDEKENEKPDLQI